LRIGFWVFGISAQRLAAAPAFDVQLGVRFLERGLHGRDLFLPQIVFHRGPGRRDRFFGGGSSIAVTSRAMSVSDNSPAF
jgi:hypothetical protein